MPLTRQISLKKEVGQTEHVSVRTGCHIAHPTTSSRIWDYVSASRLNLWLRCPKAFELRYVHGVDTPTTNSLFFGKQIHAALEYVYRTRQLGREAVLSAVLEELRTNWNEAIDNGEFAFEDDASGFLMLEKAVRLIEAYVSQIPDDEPLPLAVETTLRSPLVDPVSGEDMGIPILGIVDLIFDDPVGPVICDFKTAASSQKPVEITHEVQLGSYAYLLRQTSGQVESAAEIRVLVKTKTPQIIRHRFGTRSEQQIQRWFAIVRAYLDDLDRGEFLHRPGWTCRSCEFRKICV